MIFSQHPASLVKVSQLFTKQLSYLKQHLTQHQTIEGYMASDVAADSADNAAGGAADGCDACTLLTSDGTGGDGGCIVRVQDASSLKSADGGMTFCLPGTGSCYTVDPELQRPHGELLVLHEDSSVLVVEKPAFLPTENTRTIKDSVRARLSRHADLRLPHRLDWETSGLLVIALSKDAMRSLSRQFAERSVRKVYVADVLGQPPAGAHGTIELPLSADPARLPRQRVDFGPAGKLSRTEWVVQRRTPHAARLRLAPHSGRRHQLRVHCLALGCAIAGDSLYAALSLPTSTAMPPPSAAAPAVAPAAAPAAAPPPAGIAGVASIVRMRLRPASLTSSPTQAASVVTVTIGAVTAAGGATAAGTTGTVTAAGGATQATTTATACIGPCQHQHTHEHITPSERLHLHAAELGFAHPVSGAWMEFHSEPPFALEAAEARASWSI